MKEPGHLGDGEPRRIELSQRRRALDQGKLGSPHAGEVELCLRDSAGAVEPDCILGVARDFADELVQLFRKRRSRGHAQGQAMAVGVTTCSFLTRARTGTGALARVASVGGNLPFACHDQATVERVLAASSIRSTPLPSMIPPPLPPTRRPTLPPYSATHPT